MFAGSFFLEFHWCREGSSVKSEKRGVDELYVNRQCTSLDLMFSRQFEKHGVSRFTCFRSLFGCRRSATRICTWKTNWKKKRNILLRTSETEQKKEVQSHVFEVVTFRSRLVCWRCLELHMSMRRLSSNSGCSVHVRYFNCGRRFPHSSSPRVSLFRLSKQSCMQFLEKICIHEKERTRRSIGVHKRSVRILHLWGWWKVREF